MCHFCYWLPKNRIADRTESPVGVVVLPLGLSLNDAVHLASLYAQAHGETHCYIGTEWVDPVDGLLTNGVVELGQWE